ncbi:hypothetical protein [Ornithinimicrobium kibberense]|uniref:hypothetical protein n=1 Tax=Ornithinimicrobium kibberense TaxID=282060 RepID=UPI00361E6F7C
MRCSRTTTPTGTSTTSCTTPSSMGVDWCWETRCIVTARAATPTCPRSAANGWPRCWRSRPDRRGTPTSWAPVGRTPGTAPH